MKPRRESSHSCDISRSNFSSLQSSPSLDDKDKVVRTFLSGMFFTVCRPPDPLIDPDANLAQLCEHRACQVLVVEGEAERTGDLESALATSLVCTLANGLLQNASRIGARRSQIEEIIVIGKRFII